MAEILFLRPVSAVLCLLEHSTILVQYSIRVGLGWRCANGNKKRAESEYLLAAAYLPS
jgi:hypothetical protein